MEEDKFLGFPTFQKSDCSDRNVNISSTIQENKSHEGAIKKNIPPNKEKVSDENVRFALLDAVDKHYKKEYVRENRRQLDDQKRKVIERYNLTVSDKYFSTLVSNIDPMISFGTRHLEKRTNKHSAPLVKYSSNPELERIMCESDNDSN